jgi:hypothetical protein
MNDEKSNIGDGFQNVPEKLVTDNLAIRCLVHELEPEMCDGWVTNVEIDPTDVTADGYGRLHFADHIPTECPECGDRVLAYNGVEVTFHA